MSSTGYHYLDFRDLSHFALFPPRHLALCMAHRGRSMHVNGKKKNGLPFAATRADGCQGSGFLSPDHLNLWLSKNCIAHGESRWVISSSAHSIPYDDSFIMTRLWDSYVYRLGSMGADHLHAPTSPVPVDPSRRCPFFFHSSVS